RLAWLAADPVRFGVALLALALVRPLFAWPTTLLAVAAGYGYGPAGFPLALALIVLTSVPPYLVARRIRSPGTLLGRAADAGARFVDAAGGTRSVTASRLIPAPSDVVSVAAGAAGVALVPFVVGTALGEVPWAVAGILAGSSFDTLSTGSLAAVVDPRLVVAAVLAGVLLLAPPAYRHLVGDDPASVAAGDGERR
ncbi:MAG: VTT domain-containing protein, partial [Salinigranum sp.]